MSLSRGTSAKPSAKVAGIQQCMSKEFNIPIVMTAEEADMVSLPQRTGERNRLLTELLSGLGRPAVVVDGYACIGGDTLSFAQMASLNGLKLDIRAVQTSSRDDMGRFPRLVKHVDMYFKNNPAARKAAKVTLLNKPIQDFIVEHKDLKIDLLYLDPPWNLPEGFDLATNRGTDCRPSLATTTYISRIGSDVFGPLILAAAQRPKFICLKAPTPFAEFSLALFEAAPSFSRGYTLRASIPFRDKRGAIRLYYHILEDRREERAMNPGAKAFVPKHK